MSETATSEDQTPKTEAPTQRLAFDKDDFEKEVPQFLRKKKKKVVEPENNPEDLETETANATSVDNPTENTEMENITFGSQAPAPTAPAVNDAVLQNLAEMTIEQLKTQQAEIDRRIQEKQSAEKQGVINQVVQVVRDYDIPIEELVEALGGMKFRRKGTKAKAKYRDPASGTTWSGRGKEPSWIKGFADRTPFEI